MPFIVAYCFHRLSIKIVHFVFIDSIVFFSILFFILSSVVVQLNDNHDYFFNLLSSMFLLTFISFLDMNGCGPFSFVGRDAKRCLRRSPSLPTHHRSLFLILKNIDFCQEKKKTLSTAFFSLHIAHYGSCCSSARRFSFCTVFGLFFVCVFGYSCVGFD